MKQIINGKLYSTDSATLKAYWDTEGHKSHEMADYHSNFGLVGCDFEAQSLYRTNSGEYFLWMTEERTKTNKLELLSEESLMDWLECYDYSDEETAQILDVELA
jgi:hypothetical protein